MYVLRLLRQSHRSEGTLTKTEIAKLAGLHRCTVTAIIEQAAIHWLEDLEAAERLEDLASRDQ